MNGFLRVVWLVIPVFAAGIVHVAVLRFDLLRALDVPIDRGRMWRGRPALGANKTWRGVAVMTLTSAVVMQTQAALGERSPAIARITAIDFSRVNPLAGGAIYGLGYVAGELPNSFVKRRLGIRPGRRSGGRAWLQYLVDQLDSVVGCLVALRTFYRPTPGEVIGTLGLGAGLHIAIDASLYLIGVKRRS
jgi:CDP-diglyceride synthetase